MPYSTQFRCMATLALLGALSACPKAAEALPLISEIMAVNNSTIADEDGDYSDWIEIVNPTGSALSLANYSLSDDAAVPRKWVFPNTTIPPYGVIVVFASDKNRRNPAGTLHTNFKLTSGGEYLGLFPPASNLAVSEFAPFFPSLTDDESYGLVLEIDETPLVAPGTEARWHVPASAAQIGRAHV